MSDYDVIVIGAGPGGYVAAIRASQLGLKVGVVERDTVGGICLNWGCIPSKSLLRNAEAVSMFQRAEEFGVVFKEMTVDFGKAIDRSRQVVERLVRGVQGLLKKNNVELIKGSASLTTANTVQVDGQSLSSNNIIVASGARPKTIPALPIDGSLVVTYREALTQRQIPQRVIVVGGGATGVEFAYVYNAYGAHVTIVEMLPNLLPHEDEEISRLLEQDLSRQGIEILTNATVRNMSSGEDGANLTVTTHDGEKKLETDRVLVCIGIMGNVANMGLENAGVQVVNGFISTDSQMSTGVPGMYAIGDVTGKMPLAHVAQAQGIYVVETIAEKPSPIVDYNRMPRATYCIPQVTSMGLTERQAKEHGIDYKVGKFPFQANGKALAMGEPNGLVKLIVDTQLGEIVGAHMVGHEVTETLAEISMANLLEGTTSEIGRLVHAHPTLSEAIKEAALAANGEAIHI